MSYDAMGVGVGMGSRPVSVERRGAGWVVAALGWVVALVAAVVLMAAVASPASAAFGDGFGIAPVNVPGAPSVPALPGTDAFWAGACDVASAPAPGGAVEAPGVGVLPTEILAPAGIGGFGSTGQQWVSAPPLPAHCIDRGAEPGPVGTDALPYWGKVPVWRLPAAVQAGGHPDGSATFAFTRAPSGAVDGTLDDIVVDLPAGFIGDPNAVPKCAAEQFAVKPLECPPETQVGVLHLHIRASIAGNISASNNDLEIVPVYNLEPRDGNVAELGFANLADVNVAQARVVAKARTNGDFGVTTFIGQVPAALPIFDQTITLWGVPWARAHDRWRAPTGHGRDASGCGKGDVTTVVANVIPPQGFTREISPGVPCAQSYDPSWGDGVVRPFLSNLTECDPQSPVTTLRVDSYQHQGAKTVDGDPDPADPNWKTAHAPAAPVTGCEKPPFAPQASFTPTSLAADSPSGLAVDIRVPQNRATPFDPPAAGAGQGEIDAYLDAATAHWASDAGLATAQLDKTVVVLPEGVSVNPSAATGLVACPDAVIGVREYGNPLLFDNVDPFDGVGADCPDGSKIGTVEVQVPLLDEPLTGELVLGQPRSTDPASGEMFRLFLVLRNEERGLVAKIYGSTVADPATGRLTTTFDNNPRVPFEDLHLDVSGGPRGVLGMPQSCGAKQTRAVFDPWTAAHGGGGPTRALADGFTVGGDCSLGFAPSLVAGMDDRQARGNGSFSFRFARREGQQRLAGLTATLPQGLLASVRHVELCTDAEAAAAACPLGSQIGVVDAKAGSGDPFVLERKGRVYLTEGYKGGEYGLAVDIRPIAGPFRGAMELSPIVVRQALHVDRRTAQVTAVSDPLPLVHHGIPLRVREVTVIVDRPNFMVNPSDCSPKQVQATLLSAQRTRADVANRFQAAGCAALAFKPRIGLRLKGRRQAKTGGHPAVRARVRQRGVGEAGIEQAEVRLPRSLALDVNNAQALCEFEDGTKDDLENHCPDGSIVGRARAISPLLKEPLAGDVYFVKNIRIDPDTGNEIRTLPMIVVALRGEIAVNLTGESSVDRRNRLVNTFADVPDAPISKFNMNIQGGRNGILTVTRTERSEIDLCTVGRQIAEADTDGHNGRRRDFNIVMRKPCPNGPPAPAKVCRKHTNNKQAQRRCVAKVKRNRAQIRRKIAKRKAAKRQANRPNTQS